MEASAAAEPRSTRGVMAPYGTQRGACGGVPAHSNASSQNQHSPGAALCARRDLPDRTRPGRRAPPAAEFEHRHPRASDAARRARGAARTAGAEPRLRARRGRRRRARQPGLAHVAAAGAEASSGGDPRGADGRGRARGVPAHPVRAPVLPPIRQLFPGSVPGLSVERIHTRSLATSQLARRLASPWADEGRAFVAGLLHGVGQLVRASRARPASPKRWS